MAKEKCKIIIQTVSGQVVAIGSNIADILKKHKIDFEIKTMELYDEDSPELRKLQDEYDMLNKIY